MKNHEISVIVADDHEVYLDGLELLIGKQPNIQLIAKALNGRDLLNLAIEYKPDVVVADLRMPYLGGIEIVKELNAWESPPSCIIISMFGEEHLVVEAAEAGALGYVTKGSKKEELVEAICSVHQKKPYYCKSTASRLITYFMAKNGKGVEATVPYLDDEEKEIVRFICDGLTSKEIGEKMFKGRRWVELTRVRIANKLQAKTSVDILKTALRLGIYVIP